MKPTTALAAMAVAVALAAVARPCAADLRGASPSAGAGQQAAW